MPSITDIPTELMILIFSFLRPGEEYMYTLVCKEWHRILQNISETRQSRAPKAIGKTTKAKPHKVKTRKVTPTESNGWTSSEDEEEEDEDETEHKEPPPKPLWQSKLCCFTNTVPRCRWAIANGAPCDELPNAIATGGSVEVLKAYLTLVRDHTKDMLVALCRRGRLDMLEILGESLDDLQQQISRATFSALAGAATGAAAESGNMEVLEWLIEHDCKPLMVATCMAAKRGDVRMLRRIMTTGMFMPTKALVEAASHGQVDVFRWVVEEQQHKQEDLDITSKPYIIAFAAGSGNPALVAYLHEVVGIPLASAAYSGAAISGKVEMLEWLKANNCPRCDSTCDKAAEAGNKNALIWAHENGFPWTEATCAGLAAVGNLEMLQWVRARNCPWSEATCVKAAGRGHLSVLQWAREKGCPWSEAVTTEAFFNCEDLNVLKWLIKAGCPVSPSLRKNAAEEGLHDIVELLEERGC